MATATATSSKANVKGVIGHVTQVTGAVVDVQFDQPPASDPERSRPQPRQPAGARSRATSRRIRCAPSPWTRPRAWCAARSHGHAERSRFGRRRDTGPHHERDQRAGRRAGPVKRGAPFWPAPSYVEQSTEGRSWSLASGRRPAAPYARGGKIGLFGGAGVGKTVIIRS